MYFRPIRALILAGGQGTRLRSVSKDKPKPLMKIKGKPTLEHLIIGLREHYINNITISVGHNAKMIMDYFGDGSKWKVKIRYSIEKKPMGTGGAVRKAALLWKQPFILLWGDNLANINYTFLKKAFSQTDTKLMITLTQRLDVENFGVAELSGYKITNFVEKPKPENAPSNWINAGFFIIDPILLQQLSPGKSSIERALFEPVVREQKVYAYFHHGLWLPTDTPEKLRLAQKLWKPIKSKNSL